MNEKLQAPRDDTPVVPFDERLVCVIRVLSRKNVRKNRFLCTTISPSEKVQFCKSRESRTKGHEMKSKEKSDCEEKKVAKRHTRSASRKTSRMKSIQTLRESVVHSKHVNYLGEA